MTIDEHSRHQLYLRLEEVLGNEQATTLMEHLPPVGWADVARQSDIAYVRQDIETLRNDLASLRHETRAGMDSLRQDLEAGLGSGRRDLEAGMASGRRDLESGLGSLRQELQAGMGSLRQEMGSLRQDLEAAIERQGTLLRTEMGQLEERLGLRLEVGLAETRAEFHRELRLHSLMLMGATAAIVTAVTTIGQLLG